jgi:hypothetical protein
LANAQVALAGFAEVDSSVLYPPIDMARAETGYRCRLIWRKHLHLIATLSTPRERHCLSASDDEYLIKFDDDLCPFPFHAASRIGLSWPRAFIKMSAASVLTDFIVAGSSRGRKYIGRQEQVLTRLLHSSDKVLTAVYE